VDLDRFIAGGLKLEDLQPLFNAPGIARDIAIAP